MKFFTIPIWKKEEYKYETQTDFIPTLTGYLPDGFCPKKSILIIPGGSYAQVTSTEAEVVALKFLEKGYNCFILTYTTRLCNFMKPINYQALQDVSRAIKIIRKNSKQWQVNPDKIGVIGFSAGGHLAASLAVHYNKDFLKDNMNFSNKPNCVALGYPVILTGEFQHKKSIINLLGNSPSNELLKFMSLEKNVTSQVPPTFLWHSQDDLNVPIENSFLFVAELLKNKVPFENHFFQKGGHGHSTADIQWEEHGYDPYNSPTFALNEKIAKKEIEENFGQYNIENLDFNLIKDLDDFKYEMIKLRSKTLSDNKVHKHVSKWFVLCFEWLEIIFDAK